MPRDAELLLVEDDEDDITIALRALRRHGLEDRVTVVRDGQEALELILSRQARPKVVLLDLKLPRVGGRDVLRGVRADDRTRDLPVVVLSSSPLVADVQECYRLGANSYVVKQYGTSGPGDYLATVARYWLDLNLAAPASESEHR
jgi:CheY-like chemotaxis protein